MRFLRTPAGYRTRGGIKNKGIRGELNTFNTLD
jgi:hypothetical protein